MAARSAHLTAGTLPYALISLMTFHRPWLPLFVAGCLFSGMVEAQQDAGGGSAAPAAGGAAQGSPTGGGNASPAAGSAASPGASSSFGAAPSAPAAGNVPNAPSQGATPFGTQNPQGQGTQNQGNPDTNPQASDNPAGGSASAFGSTEKPAASQLQQAPATFTVPGFYGRGTQTFTVGEGRLARPRFRFSGNMSVGYDDNVFQTPTHGPSSPAQKVEVLETPGTAAANVQVLVPSGDPNVPDTIETVRIPAVAPKFRTVKIPAVPEAERIASWVTRTDAKWDMQFANRRTLFTFDLGGGVDYYWNRPGKKNEYTGNLSMVYLRKVTGRLQFTAAVNMSYQSQPDFSQPNVPTRNNVGSYLTANAKADVSYRLTPRFSSVTSVTYDTVLYQETGPSADNYGSTTFGTELRYLFSPRLTLVGELRYSSSAHDNTVALDTTNYYALIGGELTLSRRFTASLRIGEVVQEFSDSGDKQSSPYLEASLNYRLSQQTILAWNARYGYEESGAVNTRTLVARTGLQLTQIFTPRFQGVLTLNFLRNNSKFSGSVADVVPVSADGTVTTTGTSTGTHNATIETTEDTLDTSLGFYYTLDRHWSLNMTYSYTMFMGAESTLDYYRQRIFVGAAYQF